MFKCIGSAYYEFSFAIEIFLLSSVHTESVFSLFRGSNLHWPCIKRKISHGVPLVHLADMFQQMHFLFVKPHASQIFRRRWGIGYVSCKTTLVCQVCVISLPIAHGVAFWMFLLHVWCVYFESPHWAAAYKVSYWPWLLRFVLLDIAKSLRRQNFYSFSNACCSHAIGVDGSTSDMFIIKRVTNATDLE